MAVALGVLEPGLFFPASLIIVGAHYLLFISLYGMRLYAILAAALVVLGVAAMFWLPFLRDVSGWTGAAIFLIFSVPLYLAGRAPRSSHDQAAGVSSFSE